MRIWLAAVFALLFLGLAVMIACSGGDDDDDDSGAGDDDDDASGDDDDAADDDAADDDAADDDVDDDATDDDDDDDETWTDAVSGLTWPTAPASGNKNWADAQAYCGSLTTAGGGWRLPTISELRTLIRGCDSTVAGGSCGVTDSCAELACQDASCYACNEGEGPTDGCYSPAEMLAPCGHYWSNTEMTNSTSDLIWIVNFAQGDIVFDSKYNVLMTRCVR